MVCQEYQPQGKNCTSSQVCRRRTHLCLCALGYIRHPEVKNAIVMDSETRWIIQKIFDLACYGAGAAKNRRSFGGRTGSDCRMAELSAIWDICSYL